MQFLFKKFIARDATSGYFWFGLDLSSPSYVFIYIIRGRVQLHRLAQICLFIFYQTMRLSWQGFMDTLYNKTLHTRVIEPVLLSRAKMAQQFFKELVSPTQFPRGTQKEGGGGQRRVAPSPR